MQLALLTKRVKKAQSAQRKHLLTATYEGVPAIAIYTLLGIPFLTGYLLYLGATSFQVGFVLALPSLANVVQIAVAFLMQKIENRKLALLLTGGGHRVLWTLTGVIPFVFPQDWWVPAYILLFSIACMFNSAASVVWSSLISDVVPAPIRGRYFGIRNTILWGVSSLCMLIGGQILDHFSDKQGFAILYIVCAVFTVMNLYFYWLYPNPPFEKSRESGPIRMISKPFKDRIFFRAMMFISIWLLLQGIAVPLFSFVMLDIMKISYFWVSLVTTVQTLVMMFSYYFWGNLNARYSTRSLLLWTFPIIALSCLLWSVVSIFPALLVLIAIHVLFGVGNGGYTLLVFNFTIGDTPKADRPMFIAVFAAITGLAGFIGPLVGGKLYEWVEPMNYWMQAYGISTGIGVILILVAIFAGPAVFKDKRRKVI